jgi:hypothetical protein
VAGEEKKIHETPHLLIRLKAQINTYKAGSAIDANVFWIHLKPREIAKRFEEQTQVKVSNTVVKRVFKSMNFKFRKMHKNVAIGSYANRN